MKVTQEKLSGSRVGLEIEIPAEMSKKVYEKVVQDLSRTAKIPGFRKGKVPRQVLLQRFGSESIKQAVLEDLIQDGFKSALQQEDIPAIGNYQVLSSFDELVKHYQPGESFTFSAAVDVPPEVQLGDYASLKVQAEENPYDVAEVDQFLEERRTEKATLIPVEGRNAQSGDVAVVDYTGKYLPLEDGEESLEISGAQVSDFEMELSEGRFLDDIVKGIIGMNIGETKEVSVEFPDDYPREDLAGKTTLFTISLKDLKEKELPALDDDFAQEVSEFETLSELQSSLEQQFQEKAEQGATANIENAILKELLNYTEIDLPETMIQQEVETMLRQTLSQLQSYGIDTKKILNQETMAQMQQESRPEAINRLKQSLALEEIGKQRSLTIPADKLEAEIDKWKKQLAGQKFDPERLQEVVESDLMKEEAMKWLRENVTVELLPPGSLAEASEAEENVAESEVSESAATTETPE
ncbi:trigger factor [Merismopedia glauca]|uniref:Trigger factor n=2 Tax=Merismopedia TaxID=53402 RepID=A0A2T1BXK5_9CYAN|nr:trigger factor [Merismopedia glauca]PSB00653.1 trigger factor [Merismopedia glauca CCAP 1448/3]